MKKNISEAYQTMDLIDAIHAGNTIKTEEVFQNLMNQRIQAAIDQRSTEIRSSMFESPEQID